MRAHKPADIVRKIALFALIGLLILPGQAGQAANPTAKIEKPIPLFIAISHAGEISVTSGDIDVPNRVVVLTTSLDSGVLAQLGGRMLAVRLNGKDTLYDLRKHPVISVQFDRGYYSAVRLSQVGNTLLLEAARTLALNEQPMKGLVNQTNIQTQQGRRSCFESKFKSGMTGAVVNAVRLRALPYVPENVDENWIGSLRKSEKLLIRDRFCNEGVWLLVQRESGRVGWAKEWGLSETLLEKTFIEPAE
ncbi:MAG: hypothetical protein JXB15_04055 [Anaerolineales bacterium]|nr:hypothetical protein [Anaerolineales bacterium]